MNEQILDKLTKEELEWILKNPLAVSNAWEERNKPQQPPFTCNVGDCFIDLYENSITLYKVRHICNDLVSVDIIDISETSIDEWDDDYTFAQISNLESFDKDKFEIISKMCKNLDETISKMCKEVATKSLEITT